MSNLLRERLAELTQALKLAGRDYCAIACNGGPHRDRCVEIQKALTGKPQVPPGWEVYQPAYCEVSGVKLDR